MKEKVKIYAYYASLKRGVEKREVEVVKTTDKTYAQLDDDGSMVFLSFVYNISEEGKVLGGFENFCDYIYVWFFEENDLKARRLIIETIDERIRKHEFLFIKNKKLLDVIKGGF